MGAAASRDPLGSSPASPRDEVPARRDSGLEKGREGRIKNILSMESQVWK